MYSPPEVLSPCIGICLLNNDNICEGCYRTAEEITDWMLVSDKAKLAIINAAEQRKIDLNKE